MVLVPSNTVYFCMYFELVHHVQYVLRWMLLYWSTVCSTYSGAWNVRGRFFWRFCEERLKFPARVRLREEHARLEAMQVSLETERTMVRQELSKDRDALRADRAAFEAERRAWRTQSCVPRESRAGTQLKEDFERRADECVVIPPSVFT